MHLLPVKVTSNLITTNYIPYNNDILYNRFSFKITNHEIVNSKQCFCFCLFYKNKFTIQWPHATHWVYITKLQAVTLKGSPAVIGWQGQPCGSKFTKSNKVNIPLDVDADIWVLFKNGTTWEILSSLLVVV